VDVLAKPSKRKLKIDDLKGPIIKQLIKWLDLDCVVLLLSITLTLQERNSKSSTVCATWCEKALVSVKYNDILPIYWWNEKNAT
jgi:hypothetical protein